MEAIKMNLSSFRIPRDSSDLRSLTNTRVHQLATPLAPNNLHHKTTTEFVNSGTSVTLSMA